MKSIYKLVVLLMMSGMVLLQSCEVHEVTMEEIHDFEEANTKTVPTAYSLHTRVEQRTQLNFIVGVNQFYDASEGDKQAVAIQVGQIALEKLGGDLRNGKLILTKMRDYNRDETPKDAIYVDMKIDSLKEAMKPKDK